MFPIEAMLILSGLNNFIKTVSIKEIDGGNRVTFTDIEGEKRFDVLNGKDAQGGTVTYKIPKEYYETEFTDSNTEVTGGGTAASFCVKLGKIVVNSDQMAEDEEAGLWDCPEDFDEWTEEAQVEYTLKIYEKYATVSMYPWSPPTEKPLLYYVASGDIGDHIGESGALLNKYWKNDFKILVYASNGTSETYAYLSPLGSMLNDINTIHNNMLGFLYLDSHYDENEKYTIIDVLLISFLYNPTYNHISSINKSYVTNADVKEVTITYTPNTYMEEYDNE